PGQTLQVAVLDIDEYKNRVSLSTKVLESYPGELLEKMDEVMANAEERFAHYLAQKATENPN
ncbi:MAG: 30S ribosomal protein S1, partial [Microcystaceae cyanobacterium]